MAKFHDEENGDDAAVAVIDVKKGELVYSFSPHFRRVALAACASLLRGAKRE